MGMPLKGIMGQWKLLTVTTLGVPMDQATPVYEATSAIPSLSKCDVALSEHHRRANPDS